jgi:hypothetical protein
METPRLEIFLIQSMFVCTDSQDCVGAGMCTPVVSPFKVPRNKVADGAQCDDSSTIYTGLACSSSLPGTAKGGRAKASGRKIQIRERFVVQFGPGYFVITVSHWL